MKTLLKWFAGSTIQLDACGRDHRLGDAGKNGEGAKSDIKARIPPTPVTVFHEVVLHEGDRYTMHPNTNHWFQAGPEGAIVSKFPTKSRDGADVFTDKRIRRIPEVET